MPKGAHRRPPQNHRPLMRRILVVTEGVETEHQYIEGINSYLRSKGASTVVRSVSVGKDPLKVVQKCIEKRDEAKRNDKEYDECVCLVDVDTHETLPDAIRCAQIEGIKLLITNLKFEVWLRWHAEDKRSALTSSQLDSVVANLGLVKKDKKKKHLSQSFPFHKVDKAYSTARAADPEIESGRKGPNPSSAMPILVDLMQSK